jgi:N-methylhydantoinase A
VGGTFTDLVAIHDGTVLVTKVPSTPQNQSEGVTRSVQAAEIKAEEVVVFAHGATVATNALLERRGAKTALITTEGFRDVLEIGRQDRPSLYDLTRNRPPTLAPRELRFTVSERMGPAGEITPLDEESVGRLVNALKEAEVEAVAVCLLFAFMHPEHEKRIGEVLRAELSDVHVSLSSEVLPEFREYERFSTTAADAYLGPRLAAYLKNLDEEVESAGMPAPTMMMQSSGGVIELDAAARRAAACVLSGPAGGVVGAAYVAAAGGYRDLLTFDMGGTSSDVAPILDGEALTTTETAVAGVPIKFPMVDVHTVSAGGGSIAWVDAGGALRVGPHSAGADPGPAAYGTGGEEPTVTDANLFLGYLQDGATLGGEIVLNRGRSEEALKRVGGEAGMDALQTAQGILRIANTEMVGALRVISVERGLDPREFALVAFGGAGPMHACALAEELRMRKVLIPRASGVLSALGLAVSDLRRDYVRSVLSTLSTNSLERVETTFQSMESEAAKQLTDPKFTRRADLRYAGQSFELMVEADDLDDLAKLASRFHATHQRRYGYRMEDETVELVNLRLVAIAPVEKPELEVKQPEDGAETGRRRAYLDGKWVDVLVLDRSRMGVGSKVEGPVVVEATETTCVVRPGWRGSADGVGNLILERHDV